MRTMELEQIPVQWLAIDDDGEEVALRLDEETGGLIVTAGSLKNGAGFVRLSRESSLRLVGAVLDLLDGRRDVVPETLDLLASGYPFPWWGSATVHEDNIRRGVMVANDSEKFVLVSGRVRDPNCHSTGAVALELEDGQRFAEAALAVLDGADPWEVTG